MGGGGWLTPWRPTGKAKVIVPAHPLVRLTLPSLQSHALRPHRCRKCVEIQQLMKGNGIFGNGTVTQLRDIVVFTDRVVTGD